MLMLHRCQWFMLFVLSFQFVQSQSFQYQEVPFVVNGKNLLNPGTGGLNNAQVSQADLDLDGVDDLIVFDRSGNVVVPYILIQSLQNMNTASIINQFFLQ